MKKIILILSLIAMPLIMPFITLTLHIIFSIRKFFAGHFLLFLLMPLVMPLIAGILLFIAHTLIVWARGSSENKYRVKFNDGRIAEPIYTYTKYYNSNLEEDANVKFESGDMTKRCCRFFFNEPEWLEKNLATIEKCGVKDYLLT